MISFLQHKNIDPLKWNKAIEQSTAATIFAHYDFLTAANQQWCALIENDYSAVMPLPCGIKFGIHYIYTPHFISRLGLFAPDNSDPQLLERFLRAIPAHFQQIDLILNSSNKLFPSNSSTLYSHQLYLNQSYSNIYNNYSQNHKRNLKKVVQHSLLYHEDGDIFLIIDLFIRNRGHSSSVHFSKKNYQQLVYLAQLALKMNQLEIVTVSDQTERTFCGALFLRDAQRTWFWFSGRDERNAEKNSMFFLLDEYIKRRQNQDIILDFNGSMNENIARFYRGFGSIKYEVPCVHQCQNLLLSKIIKIYQVIKHKKMRI